MNKKYKYKYIYTHFYLIIFLTDINISRKILPNYKYL